MVDLVVCFFSIIFVQAVIALMQWDVFAAKPEELRILYIEWIGSTQLAMWTLLLTISGGAD